MADSSEQAQETGGQGCLVAVNLDESSIRRSTPDIDHERAVAIYDLLEDNRFQPHGIEGGAYALSLSIQEQRLVMDIASPEGEAVTTFVLSLTPLRKVIRDYFLVCESYYEAIRQASPSRIEAIDMGRRGLHDEGSRILRDRLDGKIDVDHNTARRLFTLICVLHWKG
ncbi:UPF0262 family protein [Tepidamorphus sp. 3E244]|uniref:UPF0262 family protein n=1 Tax=Tepidamorphus sp. 3E244 TaxID=3385498 RepID=UPI0038FC05C6